ncbi:MAG: TIM barrel protein [Planctomycetota bacterium]|nr:TIM barrel protein [Planctomycetota bacterium]
MNQIKCGNAVFRFSVGPWNMHPGADPFGPPVRNELDFLEKLRLFKKLGFGAVQFHDDDVCPADLSPALTRKATRAMKAILREHGLEPEFVAPRLWEDPRTIDGGWTSNEPKHRKYALERSRRAIDIANELGTRRIVLWPAREGTYVREAKDPFASYKRYLDYLNALLDYDKKIVILGEMKPNEPMDAAYLPTPGHFLGMGAQTKDPKRVGILIESAHSLLVGVDPSDDMAFALAAGKLWGVHLNDQDGLKFDEDKAFGAVNLRRAFNQVWVLARGGFGRKGEWVGLDVKAMRSQKQAVAWKHLANSLAFFEALCGVVKRVNEATVSKLRDARDYEELEAYVVRLLMGARK